MKNLISLLVCSVLLISCNKEDNKLPEPVTQIQKIVKFKIDCDDCFVFWIDENGEQKNASNQNSSWEYSFEGQSGDYLELGVMNTQGLYGYNSVSVYLNDNLLILTSTAKELSSLDKNSLDNLLNKAEKQLRDDTTDKERYLLSYKIETLKEISQY